MLRTLLKYLDAQETHDAFTFDVAVTDNDRDETSREVALAANRPGLVVTYSVEPRQNIALARNHVVSCASGNYIALIDDDEFPGCRWLYSLYETMARGGCDGVLGPVLPHFEEQPPRWVTKGRFFDRPAAATGAVLDWERCRTGNALIKRQVLMSESPIFRPQFGGGGEDRDFFRRMIARGYVFVWSAEAVVWETVPATRWQRRFLIKRAFLRGKMSLNETEGRKRRLFLSSVAVPAYAIALPFTLFLGHHCTMHLIVKMCDHIGRILSRLGISVVRQVYVTQ